MCFSHLTYRGHVTFQLEISPLPENVDIIKYILPSRTIKELKQFLGLTHYYRNYINHYTAITNAPDIPTTKGHTISLDGTTSKTLHRVQNMPTKTVHTNIPKC